MSDHWQVQISTSLIHHDVYTFQLRPELYSIRRLRRQHSLEELEIEEKYLAMMRTGRVRESS